MENRYLCRGKRTYIGEWVEGLPSYKDDEIREIEVGNGKDIWFYPVDPSTICQCTGLKDKNGKLIFENDIMEAHIDKGFPEDVSRFKVEWSGNGWVINQPGCTDREYISDFETENYEVVGDIFDNPELLEV